MLLVEVFFNVFKYCSLKLHLFTLGKLYFIKKILFYTVNLLTRVDKTKLDLCTTLNLLNQGYKTSMTYLCIYNERCRRIYNEKKGS